MSTSNNTNFTLTFDHDTGGLFGLGSLFGIALSDIDPVYVSTLFTSTGTVYKVNPMGEPTKHTEKITAVTFTVNYINTSLTLYAAGTNNTGEIKLWGTHEGVFQKEEWWTRDDRTKTTRDSAGKEVDSKYVTVMKSYEMLPGEFYAGFKAIPDRTLSTSITWTITCKTATTSITFTNVTQNIHNQWDKFRQHIRPYVLKGSSETSGTTTYS